MMEKDSGLSIAQMVKTQGVHVLCNSSRFKLYI